MHQFARWIWRFGRSQRSSCRSLPSARLVNLTFVNHNNIPQLDISHLYCLDCLKLEMIAMLKAKAVKCSSSIVHL